MEEQSVRAQLEEVKAALAKNEEEHKVLLTLLSGFEGWLRLNASRKPRAAQLRMRDISDLASKLSTAERPSFRGLVLRVIREARGQELHSDEVLKRVLAFGGTTSAKRPTGVVDLVLITLRKQYPIERVASRTWRWTGQDEPQE